jgi:serine/threonine-protein kinase
MPRGGAHDTPALQPGARVGEYDLVREIGRGGMGTVYLGVQPIIGKQVAIKVLASSLSRDREMAARFIQEARTANDISHPNIVDVFSFGQLPTGELYLVMDYLVGESLDSRLEREPRISLSEIVDIFTVVCDALGAAHARGIVHRDLKPDNIFLVASAGRPPDVKLLDFGIAKLLDPAMSLTRTTGNKVLGTPLVMSPEQAIGGEIDQRSDVYSLGVILFRALTGDYPFDARSSLQLLQMHMSQPPARPSTLAPVPMVLDEIVLGCLAKSAAERPTLAEVRAALLRSLAAPPRRRPRPRAELVYAATMLTSLTVGLVVMTPLMRHRRASVTRAAVVTPSAPKPRLSPEQPMPSPELPAPSAPPPATVVAKSASKHMPNERARAPSPPSRGQPLASPTIEPPPAPPAARPPTRPPSDDEDATIDWKPAR